MLNTAADPICLVGAQGNISWSNQAFALFFADGRTGPSHLSEILPGESLQKILEGESLRVFESPVKHPHFADLQQTIVSSCLGTGDEGEQLLIFKSVRAVEDQLKARSELLASVAHDLKNPIGAIFGYTDALLDTSLGNDLSEKSKEALSRIRSTAARALELVRNYQDLMHLDNMRTLRSGATNDLNEVLRSVCDVFWRETERMPQVELLIAPEPLPVRAERVQLDRILSNLFLNALKYTPLKQKVTITTKRDSEKAVFTIRNFGSVISQQELPFIFDKGQRASSSQGTQGSGLGLYIVSQLVKGLEGDISVQSSAEEGTVFSVVFDLATPAPLLPA